MNRKQNLPVVGCGMRSRSVLAFFQGGLKDHLNMAALPASYHSSRRSRSSFTLIELLIVTAIIAILAGMLMPALNKARETAQTIYCTNNQKQIGMAFLTYAYSQKDWMPLMAWHETRYSTYDFPDAATSAFFWVKVASDYMGGKFKKYMVSSAGKQFICPAGPDDIWSVTDNSGITTTISNYRYANACGWFYANHTTQYGFADKTNYGGRRLNRNKIPTRTAVLEDGKCNVENKGALGFVVNNSLSSSNMPLTDNKSGASNRHNGYTNLFFADGHCARKNLLKMTLEEYSNTCGWKSIWSY